MPGRIITMSHTPKLTRRTFLKSGAAVAAAPTIIPSSAFGANDRVNVGYIGTGRRGGQLRDLPADTAVIALADCNIERPKRWARSSWGKEKGIKQCFQDYREMLELKELDAVIVASPDHWHALHSIHAMEAGKDVYVEKPMTLTIREGRVMSDTARKLGRVVQVGSQQRSMAANRTACELIRNGRIGKVHTIHGSNYPSPWECTLPAQDAPKGLNWDMWCGPTEPRAYHEELYQPRVRGHEQGWISFRPYSGGEMTGWGAHGLDQIQWALGMDESGPVEVWPELDRVPKDDGTHKGPRCEVSFRYANGTLLTLDGKGAGGGGLFEGEDGMISIDRGKYTVSDESIEKKPIPASGVHLYQSDHHLGNWIECIRSRKRTIADVETGHRSTTLCHLGNIARWTQRKLTWDPAKEVFVDDAAANTYLDRDRRAPWTI
jgi:predicted dehydrogenase